MQDELNQIIANDFDKEQALKELNAQVNITQAFDAERRAIRSEYTKKAENYRKQAEELPQGSQESTELETKAKQIDDNLRLFDGITSALYAPNSNGIIGDVTRAASPQVAYQIGQYFKENKVKNQQDNGNRPEEQSLQHLLAHAILGAATSYAAGNDITTGALSGAGSEVAAPALANYLYGTKYPETLSQGQKDTITSILNLATATAIYTATDGSTTDAVSGTEIGKVGVEWNGTVAVNAGINTTPIKGKGGELAVFVTSGDAFENFSIRNPKINWGEFDAGVAVTTSDTTGFGAGFGLGANYIRGGRSNIDGTSSTASTCLLVGCFNIHNDSSGKYSGYGGAIGGNSKGGVAPGGSFTYSDNKTRTLTIRDFFKRRLQ
ncbi:VENN motif pre-toxin domain-containing protein [Moraxella bovoculi]|uniref:VENN motif pre-toxin domain-containing protein n=1 Tax=Moraxella bovoculi TaxID=386891 RepID=UPI003F4F4381